VCRLSTAAACGGGFLCRLIMPRTIQLDVDEPGRVFLGSQNEQFRSLEGTIIEVRTNFGPDSVLPPAARIGRIESPL